MRWRVLTRSTRGDYDVTRLNAGARRSTRRGPAESFHLRAANVLHPCDRRVFRRDLVDLNAEYRNAHAAVTDDVLHHLLGKRDRNSKSITCVDTRRTGDGTRDADH